MSHQRVKFCDGCGKVFDRRGTEDERGEWVDLGDYEQRHGFTWEDLVLDHTFCPDCCRSYGARLTAVVEQRPP